MLFQSIQLQDVVIHILARGGHFFLAVDVHSGQLDEPAAMRKAGQARLDKALSSQAVQHHMNAFATSGFEDFLPKLRLPAVEDMLHTKRVQIRLFRRACRGEHFRARGVRKLDSCQSYTARARVNKHPLARLQLCQIV